MRLRLLSAALGLLLLAPLAACGEEDPKAALLGDWTGDFGGQTLTMSFAADGTLTLTNADKAAATGKWSLADGRLTLDLRSATGRAEALTCAYAIKAGVLRLSGADKDCNEAPDLKKVAA